MAGAVPRAAELSVSDYSQLDSLVNFLRLAAPGMRLARRPGHPEPGEQGALDVVTIAADSSVLVAVINLLPEFLRSRKKGMSVTVSVKGKRLTVTGDAEEVGRIVERFLNS